MKFNAIKGRQMNGGQNQAGGGTALGPKFFVSDSTGGKRKFRGSEKLEAWGSGFCRGQGDWNLCDLHGKRRKKGN